MKNLSWLFASALPALVLLAPSGRALAPERHPAIDPRAPRAGLAPIDHEHMYYDAPGDGSLWARGKSYKASFDQGGAVFYPAFGKRAPKNFPHALSPDRVTIGGRALEIARTSAPARDGDRVTIDRGAFVEAYDLAPGSMEQSFVFGSLPRGGDLVVHVPVASELTARTTAEGVEFASDFGRVTYSRGIAIDASGRRANATTTIEDGAVVMRVDAAFLAGATLPLTLDPVIGTVGIDFSLNDDYSADVAWDDFYHVWLASYEEVFSGSDTDVYVALITASGSVLGTATIDFTNYAWDAPRVANLGSAHQFLVVAATTIVSSHTISGRTVGTNGVILNLGGQFDISGGDVGDNLAPDVGGDPTLSGTHYYCAVWQHQIPAGHTEIAFRRVDQFGALGLAVEYMPKGALDADITPSISKSNDGDRWLVAYERDDPGYHGDIWAARLGPDTTLVDGPSSITSDFSFDSQPSASTRLAGTQKSVITFARFTSASGSSDHDIMASLLDGTSVLQTVDLSAMENTGLQTKDQVEPSVDSDGRHFVVAYAEYIPVALYYDNYYDDLALSGNSLVLSQAHVNLWEYGLSGHRLNVAAQRGVAAGPGRYFVAYDLTGNSTDHDVVGILLDAVPGGTTSPFCFGDGSGAICPCGNAGASGHGCANSAHSSGALLAAASGTPSTVSDTLVLQGSSMPANATCIFLQGSASIAPVLFGDGLRCAGGTLIRLAVKHASAGSASYPEAGDLTISVRGGVPAGGGEYSYQLWYRDPASFCTSATYNISNGVRVDWAM